MPRNSKQDLPIRINTLNTNTLRTTTHKVKGNTHIFLFFYFSSAAQQHQICTLVNFFFPNFLVMCLCGRLFNFVPNQLFCDNLYFAPNWVVVWVGMSHSWPLEGNTSEIRSNTFLDSSFSRGGTILLIHFLFVTRANIWSILWPLLGYKTRRQRRSSKSDLVCDRSVSLS